MKTYVISVGGSAIVPGKIDTDFLRNLRKTVDKLKKNNRLVLVCGGGKIARDYIKAAEDLSTSDAMACLVGIRTTKLNATLVSLVIHGNIDMPDSLLEIKKDLERKNVVVVGALGFQPDMTSDATAAQIAEYLDAEMFINLTDVPGLFNKDPNKYDNAKFIPRISFDDFWKIVSRIKFKAGQHFVLDQSGAKIIRRAKIKTIIVKGLKNLENVVLGNKFSGTVIE